ncbi:MAG: hypothetical protein IJW74_03385, partial [Oscillospiraceae bacterium]|nr:hypothetical protein [Oscillospiraceae bacterium]
KSLHDIIYDFIYYGIENYIDVINYFSPFGDISYMQGETVFYILFSLAFTATAVVCIYLAVKNGLYKKLIGGILLVDLVLMPFAMDILGAVTESHLLMHGAFILPCLMIVFVYEAVCSNAEMVKKLGSASSKALLGTAYTLIVFVFAFYSIANRTQLANVSYTKAYANYEAGISQANRIVAKIENIDGYIPGETKVMFVGVVKHSDRGGAFSFADDITGIGSPVWDTSIVGTYSLRAFINQILNVDMDIINTTNYVGPDLAEKYLTEIDSDFKGIAKDIEKLEVNSAGNCYILKNNVLILKIAERATY